jgi:beta-mannosidase
MKTTIKNLAGEWTLRSEGGRHSVPAQLPGDTHSAILNAKAIEDPYYATNELQCQDLAKLDWIYSRTFELTEEELSASSIYFHADSLDTFAAVYVNGERLVESDNMFVRLRAEAKPLLRLGENTIEIRIASAENAAIAKAAELSYPIPMNEFPVQSPHRNLVRKVQCHSGWDWGPCLMVSGANGDLFLGATNKGRIEYSYTEQVHEQGACTLKVFCEYESLVTEEVAWQVALDGEDHTFSARLRPGLNKFEGSLRIENPRLWWPNGYGEQPLYDLSISILGETIHKRVGLRTIEVLYEEDDIGLSLVVRVNGLPIFCKGANWIPSDALPQRQTRAVYEDLLGSAAKAHMNMIRVWGGGQYEQDAFYELCDEKGLLVWQDFMFACALYPVDKDFLASVDREVRHQVKRLRDHASIALWCGNNENVGALKWYEVSRANRDRYIVDYDRLNVGVLQKALEECDPTRIFWPSSPCGGPDDYSDTFENDQRGDMHYWHVWHLGKNLEAYYDVTPRFCSEFGYQSFPSLEVIRTYAKAEDFNVTSPVLEHHQRNPGGNSKIVEMFTRYFRMPDGFEGFVYLSQILQGIAIKMAVEHWRHLRPVCMGTLYWQLNDNWPVCSWASINYGGKWKLLHHMARRFFAPTIVSAFQKDGGDTVEIWVTNDRPSAVSGKVTLRVLDFSGKEHRKETIAVDIPASGATHAADLGIEDWTQDAASRFLQLTLETEHEVFNNTHFFTRYKQCELQQPTIAVSVETQDDGQLAATVSTDKPAFFFSLDAEGIPGEFDDNGFTLLPGEDRVLNFEPNGKAPSQASIEKAIRIAHLKSTYR